jgi:glyoxylase-like metal-dependent hydrolase (beta-lactamase superfamily II)
MPPILASRRAALAGAAAAVTATALPSFAKAPLKGTAAPAYYRFRVGSFEATVVSDGPLALGEPRAGLLLDLSRDDFVKTLADNFLPTDRFTVEQNAQVLNTGDRLALFDTGLGSLRIYGPDSGRLLANLAAAGIDAKDIDAVVITHAHPDHCFALMADDGSRVFPNAQIYVSQADFDFWTDEGKLAVDGVKEMIAGARRHLVPNRDRMVFVKDGAEVLPGIQAVATPGHTVGHMAYMVTSQGQSLFVAGDIVQHHVLSLEQPRLTFVFDTDGAQAVASRLRMFDMLAKERIPLLAYHFPWPGIGHVGRHAGTYRYFPTPMRSVL